MQSSYGTNWQWPQYRESLPERISVSHAVGISVVWGFEKQSHLRQNTSVLCCLAYRQPRHRQDEGRDLTETRDMGGIIICASVKAC